MMEFALYDENADHENLAGMNLADAFKKKIGGSEVLQEKIRERSR
jgi:hypothetical protein